MKTKKGMYWRDQRQFGFTNVFKDTLVWNSLTYKDRDDVLWVGIYRVGLFRFDPASNTYTFFLQARRGSGDGPWAMTQDSNGTLWVGTMGQGLHRFDRASGTFTQYLHDPDDPQSLNSNKVSGLYEDTQGKLWICLDLVAQAGVAGLQSFNREAENFTSYPEAGTIVWTMHEKSNGQFWLAGLRGLSLFDPKAGRLLRRYTVKDGLTKNAVRVVFEDDEANVWLGGAGGLSKLDPEKNTFRHYDVWDGLVGNQSGGRHSGNVSASGEVFLRFLQRGTGKSGVNAFYPREIQDNPHPPEIALTGFRIANKPVPIGETSALRQHISVAKQLTLAHHQNDLTLEFTALHFSRPEENTYAYKLEPYEKEWRYVGTQRNATYTNIGPGNYTFYVKAANYDGVWNEEGTTLSITITPPWWKTWWAYTLYATTLFAILLAVRRFEVSRARLRRELELEHEHAERMAEIDQMKSQFFANISHEFRTPLTLILGPLQKLLSEDFAHAVKQQFRLMQRNAKRLQRLINQLLDLSKLEAGGMTLEAREENVVKLIKAIVLSFSSLAERKHVSLNFDAPNEHIAAYVDRDKLEKIVSNLLSNAFKFTPEGGRVSVRVAESNEGEVLESLHKRGIEVRYLEVVVTDTGSGVPVELLDKIFDRFYQMDTTQTREQEGTGIGLALTKELVELHHGEIEVASEEGSGATFRVRLPLGRQHLQDHEIVRSETRDIVRLESEATSDENWPSELEEESSRTETASRARGASSALILIVEDNADVREYVRSHLEPEYTIAEAVNGEAGIEKALATIPDLIISDVMMPKMDGVEFCRRIKTDQRTSHIPVILLTARAAREDKLEGLETGADDYVTKPFDAGELQVRVKNLIEQRRRLRERFSREITLQPREIAITTYDEQFLQRAMDTVETHMSDPDFSTESFAKQVGMSRMQLNRKLHALTDQATGEFVRSMRLKRAAQLLAQKGGTTVVEIAYEVGFSTPSYFAKCFRQQFGLPPSEYASQRN